MRLVQMSSGLWSVRTWLWYSHDPDLALEMKYVYDTKNKDGLSLCCCHINSEFTKAHSGTFTVSTSSLSTDESMKTSLKWGHPCWLLKAFSCSLLSWWLGWEHLSVSVSFSSSGDFEWLSGIFSAQGGLISGLTLILQPFTTPHVNTAVISKSLSLALTLST